MRLRPGPARAPAHRGQLAARPLGAGGAAERLARARGPKTAHRVVACGGARRDSPREHLAAAQTAVPCACRLRCVGGTRSKRTLWPCHVIARIASLAADGRMASWTPREVRLKPACTVIAAAAAKKREFHIVPSGCTHALTWPPWPWAAAAAPAQAGRPCSGMRCAACRRRPPRPDHASGGRWRRSRPRERLRGAGGGARVQPSLHRVVRDEVHVA